VSWAADRELGSALALRIMLWIARRLGWHVCTALLYPITLYFYATSRQTRIASRDYLARALGRRPRERNVLRHLFTFACVLLDRVFFLTGRSSAYRLDVKGLEALDAILESGRGCVLLGSHMGSFDVLRAFSRGAPVKARPVMFRRKQGPLTRLLEQLDPEMAAGIIEIGRPGAMLDVHESVMRGEMVGFLADRAPDGERTLPVDFLGSSADFASGPLIIASVIEAPVMLFYGLRTGPRRYELRFEPFAERITLRRETRQEDLRRWVERYAASLAERCRATPYNWFNFYLFWGSRQDA
jgi:predicted LPLAT superfamily acyltransferase